MELIKQAYVDKDLPQGWEPYYIFIIQVNNEEVGKIVLREGTIEQRYYDGHIGYSVEPQYRGHNYAYQAVIKLKKIAKRLGFEQLVITCSPDNIASKKTIRKLNAKYLETKTIPPEYQKDFRDDERVKEIYIIEL